MFFSPTQSRRPSIAIINSNGGCGLRSMLVSLGVHDGMDAEVLVVDAASTDGSREMIRIEFPEVRIVRLPLDRGFAYTANRALEEVRGDVMVLCHPDLRARVSDLSALATELRKRAHLRVAAIVPRVLNTDGSEQAIAGRLPGMSDYLRNAMSLHPRRACIAYEQEYLSNRHWFAPVCAAFDVRVLRKLGGFDENFVHFDFDADLCKRLHDATYLIARCGELSVVHAGCAPGDEMPDTSFDAFRLDRQRYFQKHGVRSRPVRDSTARSSIARAIATAPTRGVSRG